MTAFTEWKTYKLDAARRCLAKARNARLAGDAVKATHWASYAAMHRHAVVLAIDEQFAAVVASEMAFERRAGGYCL